VAVTSDAEIGIDAERIRPVPELSQVAELVFSPAECALLRSLPAAAQVPAFFSGWTRREAWFKATGLEPIGLPCGPGGLSGPRDSVAATVGRLIPTVHHAATVVVARAGVEILGRAWTWAAQVGNSLQ
jgi:hypothetical protein